MFKARLHPLFEMEGAIGAETGVDTAPDAGVQAPEGTQAEPSSQTGVESPVDAGQVKDEKDFAKAIRAKEDHLRKQLEAEYAEKYKNYDVSQKALEYLQRTSGISDTMNLKEQLELAELQERAERENLTVEELQRRQELEELKAWKSQVEQQQKEQTEIQQFEQSLKDFCKDKTIDDKAVDHMELWKYMHENGVSKPETAFKAMRADELEKQLENAEKEGVKKFLAAKGSIPTVEGKTATGTVSPEKPKTFADAKSRAMQRLSNWGNMEG